MREGGERDWGEERDQERRQVSRGGETERDGGRGRGGETVGDNLLVWRGGRQRPERDGRGRGEERGRERGGRETGRDRKSVV